jgi:hypothetical protein
MINFYLRTKSTEVKGLMAKQGFFFDKDIPDQLLIKKFEGFIKHIEMNIEHREKDIAEFEKDSSGTKVNRESILRNIVEMGKHNYRVDVSTATAEFYFITAKAFSDFVEAQKAA